MNESHFTVRFQDSVWGISTTYDLYERNECTAECNHSKEIAAVRRMFEASRRITERARKKR